MYKCFLLNYEEAYMNLKMTQSGHAAFSSVKRGTNMFFIEQ